MGSNSITLSVLIPSIPERLDMVRALLTRIETICPSNTEVLVLIDNKRMSIGEKRQRLLEMARGKYIAYCDDDDNITDSYHLLADYTGDADVITFQQYAEVDGNKTIVDFDLKHEENEVFVTDGITKRKPFHVCAWKRELVQDVPFDSINWGEDWLFCERALEHIKTQHKINGVLHIYKHDKNISQAWQQNEQ